jgi:hypothetical protein
MQIADPDPAFSKKFVSGIGFCFSAINKALHEKNKNG